MTTETTAGLAKLREPFPPHLISKLPKETKAQAEARKNNREGVTCDICGGWHHPRATHLDYVGHAALTDRLLDVDPCWSWEPVAFTQDGLPAFDHTGGLWIKLTVCGVTRLGYGHAAAKPNMDPGAREKEVIGDALRNAAMRFGAALDLWHKGDLHPEEADSAPSPAPRQQQKPKHDEPTEPASGWAGWANELLGKVNGATTGEALDALRDVEKRYLNAARTAEPTIYEAIGNAFQARRAALKQPMKETA